MKRNTNWAALAAVCGIAGGLCAVSPAHATPNLTRYAFDIDTTAEHRDARNYDKTTPTDGGAGGFEVSIPFYKLPHPLVLVIDKQEGDGSYVDGNFVGQIRTPDKTWSRNVKGVIRQGLGQEADEASITWDAEDWSSHFEGNLVMTKSGLQDAVFLTGSYTNRVYSGPYFWFDKGPWPFCASGNPIPDPPK
jgi:hypothetical protein